MSEKKSKIIKDSVHGYIEIDSVFISVINSPEFQRLKFIEQGSFRVLYPAARHDRFIHSLGVYHLATLFSENFIEHVKEDLPDLCIADDGYEKYKNTFHYAALLHDIGHAPFSHTTEDFFKQAKGANGKQKIDMDLIQAVECYIDSSSDIESVEKERRKKNFKKDFETIPVLSKPKPHEIVSATILLKKTKLLLDSDALKFDLELAVRMIIGCTYDYKDKTNSELDDLGIKNCFIRLLNSDTMDVDKLDYITRDAFMTGFQNVSVDITRMAKSVTAIRKDNRYIYPAFRKNSISVIDNIFRAKKEHSNWVLSHPAVLYEAGLLKRTVQDLWENEQLEHIFSIENLGRTKGSNEFLLFNDSDIIPKLKAKTDFSKYNIYNEVFDRTVRRKPVWKSYYEFEMLFEDKKNDVFALFKPIIDVLAEKYFVLDDLACEKILEDDNIDDKPKSVANILKEFANDNKIKLSFVIINAKNQLESNFNSESIFFRFDKCTGNGYVAYSDLIKKKAGKINDEYFYLYSTDIINKEQLEDLKTRILEFINKKTPKRA